VYQTKIVIRNDQVQKAGLRADGTIASDEFDIVGRMHFEAHSAAVTTTAPPGLVW
jgi:hypothetical protein